MENRDKIQTKLLLIKKRLYSSTTIKNYDEPIYDYIATSDISFLLEQYEQLLAENEILKSKTMVKGD